MSQIKTLQFHPTSENSLLVTWPEKICSIQHQQIVTTERAVKEHFGDSIFESIVSYNALIIYYYFDKVRHQTIQNYIEQSFNQPNDCKSIEPTLDAVIEIPVYYGVEAGWDIAEVAKQCNMSIDQVIATHTQGSYRSYALGFTPGFCYLGSIDPALTLPRRKTPRLNVPKGAVAIAEQQTAVYPSVSPGGWHIIGQTPKDMYQFTESHFIPTISVGRQVQFRAIDKSEFVALGGVVTAQENRGIKALYI